MRLHANASSGDCPYLYYNPQSLIQTLTQPWSVTCACIKPALVHPNGPVCHAMPNPKGPPHHQAKLQPDMPMAAKYDKGCETMQHAITHPWASSYQPQHSTAQAQLSAKAMGQH